MNDSKNTPSNDESSLPTTPNAQSRAAYFEDMLPGVIASDERDGRLAQALKRRRSGVPLSGEEVRRDLKAVLSQLTVSFMQYEHSFSTFLRTPAHALDYAERVAAYAMKDYPREFEDDVDIAGLWDTLRTIHVIGYAWRKGQDKTDGKQLVVTVNKIATDALNKIYPVDQAIEKADQSDGTGRRSSSSDPTARMSKAEVMAELDKAAQNDAAAAQADTVLTRQDVYRQVGAAAAQTSAADKADETDLSEKASDTADKLDQADVADQIELAKTLDDVAAHIDQAPAAGNTADEILDAPNQRIDQELPAADQTETDAAAKDAQNAVDPANRVEDTSDQIDAAASTTDDTAEKIDEEAEKTDSASENDAKTDKVAKIDAVKQEDEDDKIDLSW